MRHLPKFGLFCLFLFSFLFLFKTDASAVWKYWHGLEGSSQYVRCDVDNPTLCECTTSGSVDVPLTACQENLGSSLDVCCTDGSCDTGADRCGTIRTWDWCRATSCTATPIVGECSFDFNYNYQSCGATDSCQGQPFLYPGQCSTNGCTVSSQEYKTCCNSDGTVDGQCTGGQFTGTCPSGSTAVMCGVSSGTCAAVAPFPCTTSACGTSACQAWAGAGGPTAPPSTPPPDGGQCTFSDCGAGGCASNGRFVSGACQGFDWFTGNGCYFDQSCVQQCTPKGCPTSPPTGLSDTCGSSGVCQPGTTQVTLSWNTVTNADWYDIRVDDGEGGDSANIADGTPNNCSPHDICRNQWTGTSMRITVQSGKRYSWWVHAGGSTNCPSANPTLCSQTSSSSDSFSIEVPPWIGPTCTTGVFSGCTLEGGQRCSDWGPSDSPTWAQCQDACSRSDPNTYCPPAGDSTGGPPEPGTISGRVFLDPDGNGSCSSADGSYTGSGTVCLDPNASPPYCSGRVSDSLSGGSYSFSSPAAASHNVFLNPDSLGSGFDVTSTNPRFSSYNSTTGDFSNQPVNFCVSSGSANCLPGPPYGCTSSVNIGCSEVPGAASAWCQTNYSQPICQYCPPPPAPPAPTDDDCDRGRTIAGLSGSVECLNQGGASVSCTDTNAKYALIKYPVVFEEEPEDPGGRVPSSNLFATLPEPVKNLLSQIRLPGLVFASTAYSGIFQGEIFRSTRLGFIGSAGSQIGENPSSQGTYIERSISSSNDGYTYYQLQSFNSAGKSTVSGTDYFWISESQEDRLDCDEEKAYHYSIKNLSTSSVTSTSLKLSWRLEIDKDKVPKYYVLYKNGQIGYVDSGSTTQSKRIVTRTRQDRNCDEKDEYCYDISYTLGNLTPATVYNLNIGWMDTSCSSGGKSIPGDSAVSATTQSGGGPASAPSSPGTPGTGSAKDTKTLAINFSTPSSADEEGTRVYRSRTDRWSKDVDLETEFDGFSFYVMEDLDNLATGTYYYGLNAEWDRCDTQSNQTQFTWVKPASPWFQVKDADVWATGDLTSSISQQCVDSSSCTEEFSLPGTGGYPGVAVYGGNNASFGAGKVSGKGWLAKSVNTAKRYDYAWFAKLAPTAAFTDPASVITDSQIAGGDLVSGYQSGGYIWRYRNGDLTINGTANLGDSKVILFVNGNLTIKGRITLNKGVGFFAAVASGNIQIDAGVSHPNQPALEGLYLSDGVISTGTKSPTADDQLYIRGSLVGLSGINLERNLGATNNETKPAEFIEYAPDLIFTFPRELAREGIVWREVAP